MQLAKILHFLLLNASEEKSWIFKKSAFTILGDVNQTINPYYKYNSLYELNDVFTGNMRYL